MPTVTEKLVDSSGSAALTANRTVVINTLGAPAVADELGLVGVTRTVLTASAAGEISATLLPGRYEMLWQIGTRVSRWEFAVPFTGGPYLIRHLGAGQVEAGQRQGWRFAGINSAIIQFQNATTGAWHTPFVFGSGEAVAFGLGAAGDSSDGPNWQDDGDTWSLRGIVGGNWHAITIGGTDASPVLQIQAAGAGVSANHRIKNGRHQFLNTETGRYHSLFLTGSAGSETHAIGPGEP